MFLVDQRRSLKNIFRNILQIYRKTPVYRNLFLKNVDHVKVSLLILQFFLKVVGLKEFVKVKESTCDGVIFQWSWKLRLYSEWILSRLFYEFREVFSFSVEYLRVNGCVPFTHLWAVFSYCTLTVVLLKSCRAIIFWSVSLTKSIHTFS